MPIDTPDRRGTKSPMMPSINCIATGCREISVAMKY
jgi:hypothetical protein